VDAQYVEMTKPPTKAFATFKMLLAQILTLFWIMVVPVVMLRWVGYKKEKDREREREKKKDREREKKKQREREEKTDRERERERDREKKRQRERGRQRDKERGR
jgi:hypothetical protein